MNKALVAVLTGSVIIGGIVLVKSTSAAASPEGRACTKMADLCSADFSPKDFDACVTDLEKVKKAVGPRPYERSMTCVSEAESCAAITGCWVGGAGVGAMGEMIKGFGSALTK